MVQNDIHRSHVFLSERKIKDTRWFLRSLLAFVKGCGRKFFACSGNGNGSSWNNRGSNGNYWSASFNSAVNARNLNFNSGGVNPQNNNHRYNGFAVRPVQLTILTILLLIIYGTDTSAALTRSISGILRCEETQVETLLCQGMGKELETEHGRSVRGSSYETLQAFAIEMFHRGLPKEEGDIRCRIQRPYRTSSIFQLYTWPVRENIYSRYIQLYQESWHPLWYRPNTGLLQKRKSELAKAVLCHAPRHQRLFHAHCQETSLGDCYAVIEKNVFTPYQKGFGRDMGRGLRYGFCDMAYGSYCLARSEAELHHLWICRRLDWLGSCKVNASLRGWLGLAYWKSNVTAILECLSESVGSVHEESAEMPILWQICGRCSRCKCRQGMAFEFSSRNKAIPSRRIRIGLAHGQIGDLGSSSWSRVSWCFHKALSHLYLESCFAENHQEDSSVRLFKALDCPEKRQFVLGYIQAYIFLQDKQEVVNDETDPKNRHIQSRYDQVYRQKVIL